MKVSFGANREVADRQAVDAEGEINQVIREVAGPNIDYFRSCSGGHNVAKSVVQRANFKETASGEGVNTLQEARCREAQPGLPLLACFGRNGIGWGRAQMTHGNALSCAESEERRHRRTEPQDGVVRERKRKAAASMRQWLYKLMIADECFGSVSEK